MISKKEEKLMLESRKTLERMKEESNRKNTKLLTEMKDCWNKYDKGREFFEEYDSVAYESKVRVDMLYYDQLLQKLSPELSESVSTIIGKLYKDINNIYEFINIKPEIYGNGINEKILNESISETSAKLSKVIYEYLDKNFYNLDIDKRREKYYNSSLNESKKLISEGTNPEDAIAFSVKVVVMENLLKHISFPFASWSRVSYLTEDIDYGKVFDQEKLIENVHQFESKLHNVAKIVAACI